MKTGLVYLLLGIISFAGGMCIPVKKQLDQTSGKKESQTTKNENRKKHETETFVPVGQDMPTENPQSVQDDLIFKIAEVAPEIYEEVEQVANQKKQALLLQVLILSNPEEAAALLANSSDEELGDHKPSLYELLAHVWGTQNPDAAYVWFQQQNCLNDSIYAYMAAGYASFDPVKALELLEFVDDGLLRQRTGKEIAKRWIYKDPAAAFNWLELQAEEEMSDATVLDFYKIMMRQYIKIEPVKAALIVEQLPSTQLQQQFTSAMVSAMSCQDLHGAMEWVMRQSNEVIRTMGRAEIVATHAYKEPEEVIDFLLNTSASDNREQTMLASAFEYLAEKDIDQAITRLDDVREPDQYEVATSVATSFLINNQEAALKWIAEQPAGKVFDGAANAVAMILIDTSPGESLKWIGRIGDPSKRAYAATTLINGVPVEILAMIQQDMTQLNLSVSQGALIEDRMVERMSDVYTPLIIP